MEQTTELKYIRILLTAIVVVISIIVLKTLKSLLMPLFVAVLLSFLIIPLIQFLEKKKIPRFISISFSFIIIIFSLIIIGSIFYSAVESFIANFPKYEIQLSKMFTEIVAKYNIPIPDLKEFLMEKVQWMKLLEKISISNILSNTLGSFLDFIFKAFLVLIYLLFIIVERDQFKERFRKQQNNKFKTDIKLQVITRQIQKFLRDKTIISAITAIIGTIIVAFFKIDFIIITGFILFLFNFIPNIGSIVASLFPLMIYFLENGFTTGFFVMALLLVALQMIMGNIVEPRVMGKSLQVSPLIIFISFIFWAWLWGPIGMVISVPVTSVLAYILKHFETTKYFISLITDQE